MISVTLPDIKPGHKIVFRRKYIMPLNVNGTVVPDRETFECVKLALTGHWGWRQGSTGRAFQMDGLAAWLNYNRQGATCARTAFTISRQSLARSTLTALKALWRKCWRLA